MTKKKKKIIVSKKRRKIIRIDNYTKKRLVVCLSTSFIVLVLLVVRIGYIQFVQGAYLKESAVKNQLSVKTITPTRGTIYDSTGKVLAISADVDTVYVNPSSVQYSDGTAVDTETLATALSEIFELDYDELLDDLNTKTSSFVVAEKVESDKVSSLEEWMSENNVTSGITIEDDVKRYYPYNNLASNLIGFTGTENTGLSGLESSLDDILSRNSWKNINFY